MRVACVLVTHLRAKVEMRRHRRLRDHPVLLVDGASPGSGTFVVDCFPAACGVSSGMTLEEALTRHGDAVALDADEPHYRRVFDGVLVALRGVSYCVERADLGVAYARVDGLEGLYGSESAAVGALGHTVPADLQPRVGVADAKFPAFVAARARPTPGAHAVTGDVVTFLAPHTIDLLPLPAATRIEMHRLGLHTMGAVADLGRHVLTDRFGVDGARAWSLCHGVDDTPVVPFTVEEPVTERISLSAHCASVEALVVAVDTLLRRVFARPEVEGKNAGGLHLLATAPGRPVWEICAHFKQPVGAWEQASPIVRSRLQADPPRHPVEEVTLTLTDIARRSNRQLGLLPDARTDRLQLLIETDRRLRPLMGGGPALYRIADVAPGHPVPEMRFLQTPIDPSAPAVLRPLSTPTPVEVREDAEGEPRSLRSQRRWVDIARIHDRWAIDLWWLPRPVTRSYYRIDPGDGSLITLFRDCLERCWYRQSA